jgi:hypothetical protein
VAEKRADELLALVAQLFVQVELGKFEFGANLFKALHEHPTRLPMPLAEIQVHQGQFRLASAHIHVQHRANDAMGPGCLRRVQRTRFGRDLERAYDDAAGFRLQSHRENFE